MGAYLPFIVWLIAMTICIYIAKSRGVHNAGFGWTMFVVIFGPFAIPFVWLFVKPKDEETTKA